MQSDFGGINPTGVTSGAFYIGDKVQYAINGNNKTAGNMMMFSASRCSDVYGASTVVRPKSLGVAWYIKY